MQVELQPNGHFRPLSAAEYRGLQDIRETVNTLVNLGEQRKEIDRQIAYGKALQAAAQEKFKEAEALEASGQQKIASGQQKIASGQQKIASGQQKVQNAELKKNELLAKLFYTIFHGRAELPADKLESVFAYIADGKSLIADRIKKFVLLSMLPVIQYAKEYGTEVCNFQLLKAEVHGVEEFAKFIATENCSVKLVRINKNISEAAKASLEWARGQRNGQLTVEYLA